MGGKIGDEVVARTGPEAIRAVLNAIETARDGARLSVALARSATRLPEDPQYFAVVLDVDGVTAALSFGVAERLAEGCEELEREFRCVPEVYADLAGMVRDLLDHVRTFGPNVQ